MNRRGLDSPTISFLGDRCCGCAACESACPVGCIEMRIDGEGFLRPQVDVERCIGCGRCERTCPALVEENDSARESRKKDTVSAYALRSLDEELLLTSSSGGAFTELCRKTLTAGGVVFGVVMSANVRRCHFTKADSLDELAPIRGSKYLQAEASGVYADVLEELRAGRKVLFSGTPCQANALRLFLGRDWPNLTVVDFVCHGVPSPWLWSEHVSHIERNTGLRVNSVSFRYKEVGWKRLKSTAANGSQAFFEPLDKSPYLRMFLRNYCLRPSCYVCPAKAMRLADITIADFWGGERFAPDLCDEFGCSLVIVRTEAGAASLAACSKNVELRQVPYAGAVKGNASACSSAKRPPERDRFFDDLREHGYDWVVRHYARNTVKQQIEKVKYAIFRAVAPTRAWGVVNKLRGKTTSLTMADRMRFGIKYDL